MSTQKGRFDLKVRAIGALNHQKLDSDLQFAASEMLPISGWF
jgi:hypothetical protein